MMGVREVERTRRRVRAAIRDGEPIPERDMDAAYKMLRRMTLTRPWFSNIMIGLGVICLLDSFSDLPWTLIAGPVVFAGVLIMASGYKEDYRRAIEWGDKYLPDDS